MSHSTKMTRVFINYANYRLWILSPLLGQHLQDYILIHRIFFGTDNLYMFSLFLTAGNFYGLSSIYPVEAITGPIIFLSGI